MKKEEHDNENKSEEDEVKKKDNFFSFFEKIVEYEVPEEKVDKKEK